MENKFPDSWKEVELGEICEIKRGSSITKKTITEGDIPVIAGGQKPAYYHNLPNRTGETLTVSGSGAYAGFVAYFNIPIFASDCSTIQAKSKDILMRYAYYFLKRNQKQIYEMQKGIAQPHVYPKDLAIMKVPLPPLQIQKQIVKTLEGAERLKQKREDADKLTKEYLQGVFYEMFLNKGFEERRLGEICDKITDGTHVTPKYMDKGIPFLRVTDLTESNTSKKFISKEEHKQLIKRCFPERGDILYTKNGTIGIAKAINWDYEFSIFVSLCLIKPKKNLILSKYLEFFLNTPYALRQAVSHSKKGTIINLHLIEIKKIKIPLPALSLQNQFASIVEEVEKLKQKQKQSKEEINQMFDSLMKQAFNGELIK